MEKILAVKGEERMKGSLYQIQSVIDDVMARSIKKWAELLPKVEYNIVEYSRRGSDVQMIALWDDFKKIILQQIDVEKKCWEELRVKIKVGEKQE